MKIYENGTVKILVSPDYNFIFNKSNGQFIRWGKTKNDDPDYSEFGPEIADIEISTVCHGVGKPCSFCYKSNTGNGKNMSLDTFKKVFNNLPKTITQIAFGIGDIDANPDMWNIFQYCKDNGVIPNVTINGARMKQNDYDRLAEFCGAVAVSHYDDDLCFNAIQELTSRGMNQINIHKVVSEDSYDSCIKLTTDVRKDKRLEHLNAIVFLSLKPIGRGKNLKPLKNINLYKELVKLGIKENIGIGFDSCSAPKFLAAMKKSKDIKKYEELSEPCESYLFSTYINVDGVMFPCSFVENIENEIDLKEPLDFMYEWNNNKSILNWRNKLLDTTKKDCLYPNCRQCPIYDIY